MAVYYPQCKAALSVIFDGFGGSDSDPLVIDVLPIRAQVNLNGYKEADTWSLEFDASVFPFSPELIRAAAVEIFMYETDGLLDNREYRTDTNRLIAGLLDNGTLSYSASGNTFSMDGRDYTALFIDKPWQPTDKVPIGKPLDQTIQDLANTAQMRQVRDPDTGKLRTYKALHPLKVRYVGEATAPIVSATAAHDRNLTQKKVSNKPPTVGHGHSSAAKHGITFKSGQNFWDVMFKLCLRHGKICYVQGTEIIISDPKTLQESSLATVPKMAFGRNLEALSVERHLGAETVPQILIVSYDKKTRKTLIARYPENFRGQQTGFGTFKQEERRYTVLGITDLGLLKELARNLYHNLARSEGRIRFTTKDLKDLDKSHSLLALRAGDAVAIGFDPFHDQEMRSLTSDGLRYSRLRELGYSERVARLVATNYDKLAVFKDPKYTRRAIFDFDHGTGISIDVEAVNFISAKRDDHA